MPSPGPRDGSGCFRNIMGRVGSGGFQALVDRVESLLPDPTRHDPRGLTRPVNRPGKHLDQRTAALHRHRATADGREMPTQRVKNRFHCPIRPAHNGGVSFYLVRTVKLCSLEELSASIPAAVAHKNTLIDEQRIRGLSRHGLGIQRIKL